MIDRIRSTLLIYRDYIVKVLFTVCSSFLYRQNAGFRLTIEIKSSCTIRLLIIELNISEKAARNIVFDLQLTLRLQ